MRTRPFRGSRRVALLLASALPLLATEQEDNDIGHSGNDERRRRQSAAGAASTLSDDDPLWEATVEDAQHLQSLEQQQLKETTRTVESDNDAETDTGEDDAKRIPLPAYLGGGGVFSENAATALHHPYQGYGVGYEPAYVDSNKNYSLEICPAIVPGSNRSSSGSSACCPADTAYREDDDGDIDENETSSSSEAEEAQSAEYNAEVDAKLSEEEQQQATPTPPIPASVLSVDYAAKSAGALVLEKSKEFAGTSNLLTGDRDRYAIVPCSEQPKYVVIGLSEDILVKRVVLASYERYSSHVRQFQLMGSTASTTTAATAVASSSTSEDSVWTDLGTYTAQFEQQQGEQVFDLKEPTWARYLQFRFLSFYGDEHYCTVSQIRVHGSTVLQGFHEQWQEEEESKNTEEVDASATATDSAYRDDKSTGTEPPTVSDGEAAKTGNTADQSSPESYDQGRQKLAENVVQADGEDVSSSSDEWETDGTILNGTEVSAIRNASAVSTTMCTCDLYCERSERSDKKNAAIAGLCFESLLLQYGGATSASNQSCFISKDCDGSYQSFPQSISSISLASGDSMNIMTPGSNRQPEDSESMVADSTSIEPSMPLFGMKTGSKLPLVDKIHYALQRCGLDDKIEGIKRRLCGNGDGETESSQAKVKRESGEDDSGSDGAESSASEAELGEETSIQAASLALAKLLKRLPSASCLEQLDFDALANQKLGGQGSGNPPAGGAVEPVFKKLTDEIKALQASVSVHDKFSREMVACYQRVLFDLFLEMESIRIKQNVRLDRLERSLFGDGLRWLFEAVRKWGAPLLCSAFSTLWTLTMRGLHSSYLSGCFVAIIGATASILFSRKRLLQRRSCLRQLNGLQTPLKDMELAVASSCEGSEASIPEPPPKGEAITPMNKNSQIPLLVDTVSTHTSKASPREGDSEEEKSGSGDAGQQEKPPAEEVQS